MWASFQGPFHFMHSARRGRTFLSLVSFLDLLKYSFFTETAVYTARIYWHENKIGNTVNLFFGEEKKTGSYFIVSDSKNHDKNSKIVSQKQLLTTKYKVLLSFNFLKYYFSFKFYGFKMVTLKCGSIYNLYIINFQTKQNKKYL